MIIDKRPMLAACDESMGHVAAQDLPALRNPVRGAGDGDRKSVAQCSYLRSAQDSGSSSAEHCASPQPISNSTSRSSSLLPNLRETTFQAIHGTTVHPSIVSGKQASCVQYVAAVRTHSPASPGRDVSPPRFFNSLLIHRKAQGARLVTAQATPQFKSHQSDLDVYTDIIPVDRPGYQAPQKSDKVWNSIG